MTKTDNIVAVPETEPIKELVVLGAGAVIQSNHSLMVKAYADQDGETLKAQREFYEALTKVLAEYRQADNKLFDQATSGYMDTDWVDGIERLVKKDENKPRGRKAAAKPNHAAKC